MSLALLLAASFLGCALAEPPFSPPHPADLPLHEAASFDAADRLRRYCGVPPRAPRDEGRAPPPAAFAAPGAPGGPGGAAEPPRLLQAVLLVRHGDRSAVHAVAGRAAPAPRWRCGRPDAADVAWAAAALAPMRSSPACAVAGEAGAAACLNGSAAGDAGDVASGGGLAPLTAARGADVSELVLGAWGVARGADDACGARGGDLTTVGWAQLRQIGAQLFGAANASADLGGAAEGAAGGAGASAGAGAGALAPVAAYRELLLRADAGAWRRRALAVVSTDYGRTALSAAALVQGALAPGAAADAAADLPAALAAMPGLGPLPLPLHVVAREEDRSLWVKGTRRCARAAQLAALDSARVMEFARLPAAVAGAVAALAGVPAAELPGTEETADALFCRQCSAQPLPCWPARAPRGAGAEAEAGADAGVGAAAGEGRRARRGSGSGGGGGAGEPTADDAAAAAANAVAADADADDGDADAAALGAAGRCLTPAHAAAVAMRADAVYARRSSNRAARLLSYPFLADLAATLRDAAARRDGAPRVVVRTGHDTVIAPVLASLGAVDGPFAWPGFAARIALELWEGGGGAGVGVGGGAGGAAGAAPRHAVRIVYDGADVTHRLACARGAPAGEAWCSLEGFAAQVQELIAPHASWERACEPAPPADAGREALAVSAGGKVARGSEEG